MGLIALLTQAIPLITGIFGSVERFFAEKAASQGESEGESLREAYGYSGETAEMFNKTLAKAKAQMGIVSARQWVTASSSVNDLHDQVDALLAILPQIKAQLPPRETT